MSIADDFIVREHILKTECIYLAVNRIANLARQKSKECGYQIRDAEAVTWAIQGVEPGYQQLTEREQYISKYRFSYLTELSCYIDDLEVKEAFEESYRESKIAQNLTYRYKTIIDEPRQARVRVLLRMVWYNITD